MRRLGDLRRLVVADVRVERGDQHERLAQLLVDPRAVGLDAGGAVVVEAAAGVGEQPRRLQEAVDDERLVDVQLEVAAGAAEVHRHVVAEHLAADHGHRLALRRVDLARHDRAPRFVLGDAQFADPAAGARGEPAHVVGDLRQRGGQRLEPAVREHQRIVRGQRLELVGRAGEGMAGEPGQLLRHAVGEFGVRVEAGAHRGTAQRQLAQVRQRALHVADAVVELRHPAGGLLAQRQRRRVLQMRAADLHDLAELLALPGERVAQEPQRRDELVDDGRDRGDVHGGGKHVVRRLALVHLVVGMDESLLSALAAEDLAGAVRQHLVHVHVGLRAAAGLPDGERELPLMLPGDHLVGRLDDGLGLLGVEHLQVEVHLRSRPLHPRERLDQLRRHLLGADLEVEQRALRLGAPQPVGRDLDGAEGVLLDARGHAEPPWRAVQ